jgi:uncharacterized protein with HEPN domain
VVRNFEIIGEAAGRLSPTVRGMADAPWARMIAFRNRLIHGYWSVDTRLVWDVIEHELPALREVVNRRLAGRNPADVPKPAGLRERPVSIPHARWVVRSPLV